MLSTLFAIGSFQSMVFSLLLFSKKKKAKADLFLAFFFLLLTLYFVNFYGYSFQLWQHFPDIIFITSLIPLCIGPVLYFYVKSLIYDCYSKKEILQHSIPILVIYLCIFPFIFHSKEEKLLYFTDKFINLPINIAVGTFLQYLSAPVYFVWILILISNYRKKLKENYSSIINKNITWLNQLLLGAFIFWMINCIDIYILNFSPYEIHYAISQYAKIPFLLFIVIIGFIGLKQGNVFTPEFLEQDEELTREAIKILEQKLKNKREPVHNISMDVYIPVQSVWHLLSNKTEKNSKVKLSPDSKTKELAKQLQNYMKTEKLYLNSELRIQDISVDLNVPAHHISHALNCELEQSFFDFVNQYRIEESKQRLLHPDFQNYTILSIAYDCGFNSKASFNRLFKKHTGLTPSQYQKENLPFPS